MFELRQVGEWYVLESPIIAVGSLGELNQWALGNGYRWKGSRNIFGGYYCRADGECLILT